jgi:hypothetical protein
METSIEDSLTHGETLTEAIGVIAGRFHEREQELASAREEVGADINRWTEMTGQLEEATDGTAALLAEKRAATSDQMVEVENRIGGLKEALITRFGKLGSQLELLVENVARAKETLELKYREAGDAREQLVGGLRAVKDNVTKNADALAGALLENAIPAIENVDEEMGTAHEALLEEWRSPRSEAIQHGAQELSLAVGTVRDDTCGLLEDQREQLGEASQAALANLKSSVQSSMERLKMRATETEKAIEKLQQLANDTATTTSQSMSLLDDSAKSVGVGLQAALGCLDEMKRILERGRG